MAAGQSGGWLGAEQSIEINSVRDCGKRAGLPVTTVGAEEHGSVASHARAALDLKH